MSSGYIGDRDEENAKTIAHLVVALNITIQHLTNREKALEIMNKVHFWVSAYSTDERAIEREILYELAH